MGPIIYFSLQNRRDSRHSETATFSLLILPLYAAIGV